jgi:hypothetical protein
MPNSEELEHHRRAITEDAWDSINWSQASRAHYEGRLARLEEMLTQQAQTDSTHRALAPEDREFQLSNILAALEPNPSSLSLNHDAPESGQGEETEDEILVNFLDSAPSIAAERTRESELLQEIENFDFWLRSNAPAAELLAFHESVLENHRNHIRAYFFTTEIIATGEQLASFDQWRQADESFRGNIPTYTIFLQGITGYESYLETNATPEIVSFFRVDRSERISIYTNIFNTRDVLSAENEEQKILNTIQDLTFWQTMTDGWHTE